MLLISEKIGSGFAWPQRLSLKLLQLCFWSILVSGHISAVCWILNTSDQPQFSKFDLPRHELLLKFHNHLVAGFNFWTKIFGELITWNLNESLVKCKCSVTFSDYNFLGLVRVNHLSFLYLRLKKHPTNTLVKISFMKIVVVLVKCCLPQNSLLVLHVWKWKWGFGGRGELDLPWL